MQRRSFFKSLASLVAAVAIAPELAFRAKLAIPVAEPVPVPVKEELAPFWMQTSRYSMCMDDEYVKYMNMKEISA